jgi:acetoacetyl-CoA synthetase
MNERLSAANSETPNIAWRPSPALVDSANLSRYVRWLRTQRDVRADNYPILWRWSVDRLEEFWDSLFDFFGVVHEGDRAPALVAREMPGAQWFPGVRLNWVEQAFAGRDADTIALFHASELRGLQGVTWGELRGQVAAVASGLRALGVEQGDRVVAYLPNIVEAAIAFLAVASIGAVWSSASPDFGAGSLIDRFAQIDPKVLLTVDGYRYGGRDFDRTSVVRQLRDSIPSLEHIVVVSYIGADSMGSVGDDGVLRWEDLLRRGQLTELSFTRVPFDHPLWILYSSGTTGLPKAIVHGHGGILLEQLKLMHFHVDARAGDRLFWFTTTGWMMWNFVISGLLTKAPIVLYDGNPGFPDMTVLWELAERAGISIFGTSPAYISACMKAGVDPAKDRDLSALRAVGATGAPLPAEAFDWVSRNLGNDTWLFSTSGGTDVCTAFAGGVPTLPVYRGEIQALSLGAKVESWDEKGNPHVAQVGELVVTEPMPSMPLFLWNDPDGRRLRAAYFEMYPGVWRHGDWIEITERGTAIIYGRSDSTINRGGIRIGTAEIYRAVLESDEVTDALIVDLPRANTDGWIELFVVLRDEASLDDGLRRALAQRIRERCSPRHVPDEIVEIAEVPRTISGKITEVPVKRILMGLDVDKAISRDSLVNPDALDFFAARARNPASDISKGGL